MKVFVISLRTSTDRRERVARLLGQEEIPFEFIDAIDGRKDEHPLLSKYNPDEHIKNQGRPAVPGEVGCYASHYIAWQKCAELNEPVLIFEDDFVLEEYFKEALGVCGEMIKGKAFIRMERTSKKPSYTVAELDGYRLVKFLKVPQCATCYAIAPECARSFIEHSKEFCYPVDVFIRNVFIHKMTICGLKPYSVRPVGADSVIGDRHRKDVKIKTRVIKFCRKLNSTIRNGITNCLGSA